ncbi:hypothetical protein [Marinobacter guineae]|nr:hypothetical protein [Marinobacter guineae]
MVESEMERLSYHQVEAIKAEYGLLPEEYLRWLSERGWGEQESGIMLYSGPVHPNEIFGEQYPVALKEVLLVGDDMAGYSIGYRAANIGWQFVGFDSAGSELEIIEEGLSAYLKS